ncbi:glycosyltransferase [Pelagibacteraceae bacterium]|jgi:GT2 family glycosyltransferase|nr:glycosyltransferase [Pelagibacteraceae bacterium]
MNNDLTLVFSSYQSRKLLEKILFQFQNKYKTIIIENSLDIKIKILLEKKFKNTEVIIPKENLGLAKSYNLGIKKAKTKFVFLNNPDMEISSQSIKSLIFCANKIKNFGAISPIFKNEKAYKNYKIFKEKKVNKSKLFKKFKIVEVDLLDNNLFINKKIIKNNLFDENYFLFFETFDFTKNLKKKGKKLFAVKKIKFNHLGASSLPDKFDNLVKKTRSFHYNWSKFYYLKKNFNYFYALKKIFPNIVRAIKKIIINFLKLDFYNVKLNLLELYGIFTAILFFKSFFRPKN